MKRITVMALALGLLALTQRVWADVYRGTIGNTNVVMELTLGDALGTGRFFDVQDHKNRVLTTWIAGMDNESLVIVPDSQLDRAVSNEALNQQDHIVLHPNTKKQSWQGEWRKSNGQRLPVNLAQLSSADVPVDSTQTIKQGLLDVSLYDYLLWQNQPMEFLGERELWGYRLAWWQNSQTRVRVFQFVSGYPPETMSALNRTLQQEWWNTILKHQVCVDNEGYLAQQIQITLLSSSLVSYINQIYHRDCKAIIRYDGTDGRQDNDSNQMVWLKPQTLSTRTAKPVALSQLLSIEEKNAAGEYRPLHVYFDRVLPQWLYKQLITLHKDELTARSEIYPAPSPDEWGQVGKNWFATTKGLRFYSNVSADDNINKANYDSWALLPWSFVKSHPAENVQNGELVLP